MTQKTSQVAGKVPPDDEKTPARPTPAKCRHGRFRAIGEACEFCEVARLMEALVKYGHHKAGCRIGCEAEAWAWAEDDANDLCDCGLSAALSTKGDAP